MDDEAPKESKRAAVIESPGSPSIPQPIHCEPVLITISRPKPKASPLVPHESQCGVDGLVGLLESTSRICSLLLAKLDHIGTGRSSYGRLRPLHRRFVYYQMASLRMSLCERKSCSSRADQRRKHLLASHSLAASDTFVVARGRYR